MNFQLNVSRETFFFLPENLLMVPKIDSKNQLVVDLLTALRNEKFGLRAWARFLGSSWERSCATARANPTLKRSWTHTTMLIGALMLAILVSCFMFEGPDQTLR